MRPGKPLGDAGGEAFPPPLHGERSHLVDRVLELWSWGYISAVTVQYIMAGAVLDGVPNENAKALARIGKSGRWLQNCQRDLKRQFLDSTPIAPLYEFDVPAFDAKQPGESKHITIKCSIMLPHWLFAVVAKEFRGLFRTWTNNGALEEFWNAAAASGDPVLTGHPMTRRADWKRKAIPFVLYGDAARFSNMNALEVVAFSALLSRVSTWASKFVIAVFVKSAEAIRGGDTWQQIWRVLLWSLRALMDGKHPHLDHNDQPWAPGSYGERMQGQPFSDEGYFGSVFRIAGDLDWYQKRLGMRVAPAAHLPCAWCNGGRPPHPPFLDLRLGADWVDTCVVAPAPRPSDHLIWDIPGVTLFATTIDPMHSADLGAAAHFIAGVFHTLVYYGDLAGTLAEREEAVWDRIQEIYKAQGTPTRLTNFGRWLWVDVDSPHTKFPFLGAKASECRHLVRVAMQLCSDFNSGSPRDAARLRAAVHLARYYDVLSNAGYHLTEAEHRAATKSLFTFMDAYQRLAADAAARGILCWNVVNKFHMLCHQVFQAKYLNPEATWTFPYEDLMGRMKRVAMMSKSGMNLAKVPTTVLTKYRHVLYLASSAESK